MDSFISKTSFKKESLNEVQKWTFFNFYLFNFWWSEDSNLSAKLLIFLPRKTGNSLSALSLCATTNFTLLLIAESLSGELQILAVKSLIQPDPGLNPLEVLVFRFELDMLEKIWSRLTFSFENNNYITLKFNSLHFFNILCAHGQ